MHEESFGIHTQKKVHKIARKCINKKYIFIYLWIYVFQTLHLDTYFPVELTSLLHVSSIEKNYMYMGMNEQMGKTGKTIDEFFGRKEQVQKSSIQRH